MPLFRSDKALESWFKRKVVPNMVPPVPEEEVECHHELGALIKAWKATHLRQVEAESSRQEGVQEKTREAEFRAEREKVRSNH